MTAAAHGASTDSTPPPDLLLVTVDTLRADAIGCYGAGTATPNIDGLAKEGVLFEDVLTTIGKTGPAFASLFTSLYPPTHGARRNGVKMRPDVPTLAELLAAGGYRTAAFVSNWTLRARLSAVDVYGGYSVLRQDLHTGHRNAHGWNADVTAHLWKRLSVTAQLGGNYDAETIVLDGERRDTTT